MYMNRKEYMKQYLKTYYQKNKDKLLEKKKKYYIKNKDKIRKSQKIWEEKNKEKLKAYKKEYYNKIKDKECKRKKEQWKKLKLWVLTYYSNGIPRCECCGETHIEFLTINHKNGGGNKHRKKIGIGNFYRWLIKNNYPSGFNVLCMNCNFSLGKFGYCPHVSKVGD